MPKPKILTVFIGVLAILIASYFSIAGSVSHSAKPKPKPRLAIKGYQPAPPPHVQVTLPNPQPPLDTWQGPVEPLPANPEQTLPPVVISIPTTEPVVFLGIDDGWVQTPEALAWLTDHKLPFTLFLSDNGIKNNYNYFLQLQAAGMNVEDHTISHPDLTKLPLERQIAEICGAADTYGNVFGIRPTLFRPPYGKANQLTLQAAQDCGMKEIVMWRAVVQNGALQYQDGLTHLQPGDIVLMHFTPNFLADIQAFMNEIEADHLQVAHLEDWLP